MLVLTGGDYRLSVCPKFLLSIHRVLFWLVILVTVDLLVQGIDLEDIYPLLGWCLLIGGLGGILSEVICKGEKKKVASFIKETLSKAVCVKGPVVPVMEPLLSHPRLWFFGFSLSVASIIQPILYSVIALAGAAVLIIGSGVLDEVGSSGRDKTVHDTYNEKPETEKDMPSSGSEDMSLSNLYINEEEGFSFMYPNGWETEDAEEIDPNVLVSVAHTGTSGVYARMGVYKEINDGSYFIAAREDFEEVYSSTGGLNDGKLMDLSDIMLDGQPARKVTYAFNNDIGVRLIGIQYFYVRGSYVYSVACIAEEVNYDKYEPIFNAIMDSYTITAANEAASSFDSSEVSRYEGAWSGRDYDRIYMEINYVDENGGYFDISISWSSSASEWTQWELWGVYLEEEGVVQYYGNQIEYWGSYETGETEENVVSEAEEGILWFGDDGLLHWDDYTEASGESYVLQRSAY